jgi:predicted RNA-binding protein Jag
MRRDRPEDDQKIQRLIRNAQEMLEHSTQAICLEDLNAYERKRIHQFYDNKPDFETKTYRHGEEFLLWIFPVAKLRQYAEEKAHEALESGVEVDLPPMSNYERFIIHDALKSMESVETSSLGEDDERHIRITPIKFGRRLKKIAKKLKFF